MKEHPILFSGPMVRAILEGLKSQTRRVVKFPKTGALIYDPAQAFVDGSFPNSHFLKVPYRHRDEDDELIHRLYSKWEPGDKLWVKETHQYTDEALNISPGYVYRATDPDWETMEGWKWKPSIYMPRKASRITLEVLSVRVERLQDISPHDVLTEGVRLPTFAGELLVRISGKFIPSDYLKVKPKVASSEEWLIAHYASLWDSLNGENYPWKENPWVWVIEFKKL